MIDNPRKRRPQTFAKANMRGELINAVDAIARARDVSRSECIRDALLAFLRARGVRTEFDDYFDSMRAVRYVEAANRIPHRDTAIYHINLPVTASLYRKIVVAAHELGIPRSDVIRIACIEMLSKNNVALSSLAKTQNRRAIAHRRVRREFRDDDAGLPQ